MFLHGFVYHICLRICMRVAVGKTHEIWIGKGETQNVFNWDASMAISMVIFHAFCENTTIDISITNSSFSLRYICEFSTSSKDKKCRHGMFIFLEICARFSLVRNRPSRMLHFANSNLNAEMIYRFSTFERRIWNKKLYSLISNFGNPWSFISGQRRRIAVLKKWKKGYKCIPIKGTIHLKKKHLIIANIIMYLYIVLQRECSAFYFYFYFIFI